MDGFRNSCLKSDPSAVTVTHLVERSPADLDCLVGVDLPDNDVALLLEPFLADRLLYSLKLGLMSDIADRLFSHNALQDGVGDRGQDLTHLEE